MAEAGTSVPSSVRADPWADLRAVRAEQARTGWWRRLVHARLDLAVARTAGPRPLVGPLALLDTGAGSAAAPTAPDDVPAAEELLALLSGPAADSEVRRLLSLRDLDLRLARYEHRLDAARARHRERLLDALAEDPEGLLGPVPERVRRR